MDKKTQSLQSTAQMFFQTNIVALACVNPELANALRITNPAPYILIQLEDGILIAAQDNGEEVAPLVPSCNPLEHALNTASKIWQSFLIQEMNITRTDYKWRNHPVLLAGLPCAHTLALTVRNRPEQVLTMTRKIIVVEKDLRLLFIAFHCTDFSEMIRQGILIFFGGECAVEQCGLHLRSNSWLLTPLFIIRQYQCEWAHELDDMIHENTVRENKLTVEYKVKLEDSYRNRSSTNLAKLLRMQGGRPPRIMMLTSLFTSFLQYCCASLETAFNAMGLQARVVKERDGSQMGSSLPYLEAIDEYKPDMIILISSCRASFDGIPARIPVVSWIQDELDRIFTKEIAKSVNERELILVIDDQLRRRFEELGCPHEQIRYLPVPTDDTLFKPLQLNDFTRKKFGAKVCFVHHFSRTSEKGLQEVIEHAPNQKALFARYYEMALARLENGDFLTYFDLLREFPEMPNRDQLISYFMSFVCNPISREMPLRWLLDSGMSDLKLYGNGWDALEHFAPYAAGEAKYGAHLNLVYNASDINLNLHFQTTTHSRFFACGGAGAFQLLNALPPGASAGEHFFSGRADVATFRGKGDFLKKINFYLNNPEKRIEMSVSLRKVILEQHTYRYAANQMLIWMADLLESGGLRTD